ncbi:hypothetical protein [Streptomyces platensis]|uniref:hypothetical protein n=1 Tax=Streptomyces platensis TaxID=58346 RepID=UPI0039B73808
MTWGASPPRAPGPPTHLHHLHARWPRSPQPAARSPQPAARSPQPAARSPQPAARSPQPAARSPQPAARSPQPAARSPQPAARSPQPAARSPQPAARSPQPAARSPQPGRARGVVPSCCAALALLSPGPSVSRYPCDTTVASLAGLHSPLRAHPFRRDHRGVGISVSP